MEIGAPATGSRTKAAKQNVYLGIVLAIFALALIFWLVPNFVSQYTSGKHGLSPRFFPYLTSGVLGVLSLGLALWSLKRDVDDGGRGEDKRMTAAILGCVGLFAVYYFAVLIIGMGPASFLALAALMRLFGSRSWPKNLIVSAVMVVILFFFFEKVAQVPIPRGYLFDGWY